MNAKKIIGVGLIFYAQHSMEKIDEAKTFFDKVGDFFRDDVYVTIFGGVARSEASKYDSTVLGLYYSGIILVIIGVLTSFFGWIQRNKY
jgi:hypothetical protein